MIVSIDTGSKKSAGVVVDDNSKIAEKILCENTRVITWLRKIKTKYAKSEEKILLQEHITSYGYVVGEAVFMTCQWEGRFIQAWGGEHDEIYRNSIRQYLCGTTRSKDKDVRSALIRRFGKPGRKKEQRFLYGIKRDMWAALAIIIYYNDMKNEGADSGGTQENIAEKKADNPV